MTAKVRVAVVACISGLVLAGCNSTQEPGHAASRSTAGSGSVAALKMIDAVSGWGYGAHRVVRTGDGGRTFIDVTPPAVGADRVIRSHDFLDASRAWVLVGPAAFHAPETLEATVDGGVTWTQFETPASQSGGVVEFADSAHGWLIGGNWLPDCSTSGVACGPPTARQTTLERTTDGGATWSLVYQTLQHVTSDPLVTVQLSGGMQMSLQAPSDCGWQGLPDFQSGEVGFVGLSCPGAVQPPMAATADGGRTWRRIVLPDPPGAPGNVIFTSVGRVHFSSAREGLAVVSQCIGEVGACTPTGAMVKTSDGGLSWSAGAEVHSLGLDMESVDASHAWLLDGWLTDPAVPSLLSTADSGATWDTYPLPPFLTLTGAGSRSFQLVTPTLGFAEISKSTEPQPRFYRTEDGGLTFTPFSPQFPPG